ncbi:MAG: ribosome silencing factor [Magnetococcales bacterium]|nr:ribosome silencing factor [Magnetococcales bacterium]
MTSDELAKGLQQALEDKKALNIHVLDLRGRSSFTDYFILATGTSDTHLRALAQEMDRYASVNGGTVLGVEGLMQAEWILVDLEDVVVHLFRKEVREFYDLEKLWADPVEQLNAMRDMMAKGATGSK